MHAGIQLHHLAGLDIGGPGILIHDGVGHQAERGGQDVEHLAKGQKSKPDHAGRKMDIPELLIMGVGGEFDHLHGDAG